MNLALRRVFVKAGGSLNLRNRENLHMRNRGYYPCSFEKACHCLWAVLVKGWTLTKAAIAFELNVGTVSHVVHRDRFPDAFPVQPPGFD